MSNAKSIPSQGIVVKSDEACNAHVFGLCGNGVGTVCLALSKGQGVVLKGDGVFVWCQCLCLAFVHEHALYPFLYGGAFASALGDAYYHICFGNHEDELAVCTICLRPTRVFGLPDMVTVSAVYALWFHHLVYPRGGEQLLAVPLTLVEQELTEGRHCLGTDVKSPSSAGDAFGTLFPQGIGDAEGMEQTFLKEVHQRLSRCLLHYGGKYVGHDAVVCPTGARHGGRFLGKVGTEPLSFVYPHLCVHGYAALHGEQVAHGDGTHVSGGRGRHAGEFADGITEGNETVLYAHSHGNGSEGFGYGIHGVAVILAPRQGIHLCHNMSMSHDNARVYLGASVLHKCVHELLYVRRGYSLCFRSGARHKVLCMRGIEKSTAHEQCYDKTDPPPTQSALRTG